MISVVVDKNARFTISYYLYFQIEPECNHKYEIPECISTEKPHCGYGCTNICYVSFSKSRNNELCISNQSKYPSLYINILTLYMCVIYTYIYIFICIYIYMHINIHMNILYSEDFIRSRCPIKQLYLWPKFFVVILGTKYRTSLRKCSVFILL